MCANRQVEIQVLLDLALLMINYQPETEESVVVHLIFIFLRPCPSSVSQKIMNLKNITSFHLCKIQSFYLISNIIDFCEK